MILLSSVEAPADYSDKNRNNSKNADVSTRTSNDGKREKAVTTLSSSLSLFHCLPRAFFLTSPPTSLLSKKKSTDGGESELILDWFLHECSVLTLSFVGFVSSYENHHWTECSCMVFTCGVVLGRKPQGISWMRRPNPARPLSLWCILLLFLRLRKLRSMILCVLLYHIPAHATRLGFAHGSLLWCWTWTTRIFHPPAGLLEDFLVH